MRQSLLFATSYWRVPRIPPISPYSAALSRVDMSDRCTGRENLPSKNHCSCGVRHGGRYKCALDNFTGCLPRRQKAEAALRAEENKIFSSQIRACNIPLELHFYTSLPFWRLLVPVRAISGAAAHLVFLPKAIECPLSCFCNVKASALTTTLTLALELASNR